VTGARAEQIDTSFLGLIGRCICSFVIYLGDCGVRTIRIATYTIVSFFLGSIGGAASRELRAAKGELGVGWDPPARRLIWAARFSTVLL
jgi:hypothetical protein